MKLRTYLATDPRKPQDDPEKPVFLNNRGFFVLSRPGLGSSTSLKTMCPPGRSSTWIVAMVEAKCIVAWITWIGRIDNPSN